MSILIYAESAEGKLKKVAFELASCKKVAESLTTVTAVTVNADDVSELSKYGGQGLKVK
jgi:electron transfer flavoprotein alpha subunit